MKILNYLTKLFFISLFLIPIVLTAQQTINEDIDDSSTKNQADNQDRSYFSNTVLINQFGEEMKFYDDLLKDKIVVINPFFSEDLGSSPVMHDRIQQIQEHLGDQLGKDVNLISITVDPDYDKPEVLKVYAEKYGAKHGWYFLSGNKENVETVLKKLGKYVLNREHHDSILLIGNLPTRLWKKVNGVAPVEEIINIFDSVVHDQEKSNSN